MGEMGGTWRISFGDYLGRKQTEKTRVKMAQMIIITFLLFKLLVRVIA